MSRPGSHIYYYWIFFYYKSKNKDRTDMYPSFILIMHWIPWKKYGMMQVCFGPVKQQIYFTLLGTHVFCVSRRHIATVTGRVELLIWHNLGPMWFNLSLIYFFKFWPTTRDSSTLIHWAGPITSLKKPVRSFNLSTRGMYWTKALFCTSYFQTQTQFFH